jgi:hypothetical protein
MGFVREDSPAQSFDLVIREMTVALQIGISRILKVRMMANQNCTIDGEAPEMPQCGL